ncbi:MAG: large-conductance mechanosensitive channel protein MscL [Firmicutes bacterium]|nr:large-conductance mechanosensitive channel protein MscL [Bacillota bacterium]
MKIIEDFKKFALKGNVIDMAVGVVVGGAFSKVVSSVVSDLITPVIGVLTAGVDFKDLKWVIASSVAEDGSVVETAITYGNFIQNVVDFLIIGFSIMFVVKAINKAKDLTEAKKKAAEAEEAARIAAEEAAKPKEPTEADLLKEIRDLLKAQQETGAGK